MSYRHLLTLLGVTLIGLGVIEHGWFLLAAWLGADFLILGVAHGRASHCVFGKRSDGSLPIWSRLIFLPLLTYTTAVWHLIRLVSREPAHNIISEELVVGRRLLAFELEGEFANYVDLTAEFAEPSSIRRSPAYRSFPILDGAAPTPDILREMVASLQPGRTFIHCAQGHGRTGLFALAVMLNSRSVHTVEDGLQVLTSVRPGIRLSRAQRRCIELFAKGLG
jgi:hypothetical protein